MSFKSLIILLVVLVASESKVSASEDFYEDLYTQANEAYKAGEYDSAKVLYSEIVQNGMVSSELFYNLGNTYFKQGQIPEAILYFERALKIAPDDEDARYNLSIANTYITDKITPVENVFISNGWNALVFAFSVTTWSIIFIGLLFIASALFTLFAVSTNRKMKQLGLIGGIIVISIAIATLLLTNSAFNQLNTKQAIVFAPSITVKSEPGLNATDQFVIHEGLKVEILDIEGDWTRIRLDDGNSGWLQSQSIEQI